MAGWISYIDKREKLFFDRLEYTIYAAVVAAFTGKRVAKPTQKLQQQHEPEEETIDTTDPEFAKHFMGFTYEGQRAAEFKPPMQLRDDFEIIDI